MKATMVSIVVASLCLSGCSGVSTQAGGTPSPELFSKPTPKPASPDDMDLPIYTEDDSSITVEGGEAFVIRLDSNPTTGYSWNLSEDYAKDVVELVGSEYQAPKTQRPGAGGYEVWQFKAVGSGRTKLNFLYRRPWEDGIAPIKTQTFRIEGREG